MFFIFKYDIKQNNIDAILRTTCFTLLSYVILEHGVKEYFKTKSIDTTTGSEEEH